MGIKTYSVLRLLKNCSDEPVLRYVRKGHYKVTGNSLFISLVSNHFRQVLKHRRWVIRMFFFIGQALKIEEREQLYDRILHHDLSKFSTIETIGYTIKFHRKNGEKNEKEKKCWEKALIHHYAKNDHHPEHSRPNRMNHYALLESVIDMLACRAEKDLSKENFDLNSILDIPDIYLERYIIEDKKKVLQYISHWNTVLHDTVYQKDFIKQMVHELD